MMLPAPLRVLILASLGGGIIVGIAATVASLGWLKPEVSLKKWYWAGSDVAAHPERYFVPEGVTMLRRLFLVSVCMFLAGLVALVAYSAFVLVRG
jgi:hypothetical protein